MTVVLKKDQIEQLLSSVDLMSTIEAGFVAYSKGNAVVPPVGELQLDKGEVHIKYGFIQAQRYYVVKIASGFYQNAELGLPTSNGCMLVFCQSSGQIAGILLDEGYLTDVRTAVAGAIAAKYLAPKKISKIGIVGTGIQAQLQLLYLRSVTDCRDVIVWGRSRENLERYPDRLASQISDSHHGFRLSLTTDLSELQQQCNLIVTTTPAKTPLLCADEIQAGTHITAVGSDTPEKQELESKILENADLLIADSKQQCEIRGEISQALRQQNITLDSVIELGSVVAGASQGRTSETQTTVADLTGVAVQDIQIATAVLSGHQASG